MSGEENIAEEEQVKPRASRKGRVVAPAGLPPTQVSEQMVEQPVILQEIPQEVRDELTSLMQELLVKTHELSFEYSTMECPQISGCQLAQKSKELFRVVKRLNELMKRVAPAQPKTS
jgi:hypothetical protein